MNDTEFSGNRSLLLALFVMGIQQRTSLDFESRSSIKKIQRLCL
ncbi:hypothetical protein T10_13457 [Trichinella papuae]|uniref:Uncharacterized protein n=1 Tax=Trichinella papuae TaxID=268474 RepID=A0A0V1M1M2_9BILA|nr:hypothetical protein T10_13457 [Trichinella papuae]